MNKMSEAKKKQLAMVLMATGAILAGIWFGLISAQQDALRGLSSRKATIQNKRDQMLTTLKTCEKTQAELAERSATLDKMESVMASGDLFSWMINTVKKFKAPYKVEIPQFGQINGPTDVNLLPNFPYKQASVTILGSGNYYDIGKFVADFENEFPFARLANMVLEPVPAAPTEDKEKLSFRIDLVTLVKPSNS
jgi:Tfp pilus assembly protein PilO